MAKQIIILFYSTVEIADMSLFSSDVARINALIGLLGLVMTIGRYLPLIVGAFAFVNLTIAVMSFVVWNSIISGVINSVLALGGFIFLGQLLRRRKIHRYEYRYKGRESKVETHVQQSAGHTTSDKTGGATA